MRAIRLHGSAVILLGAVLAAGCKRDESAAPMAPPPPGVTVSKPVQRQVIQWNEFTGHLEAPEIVQVSARVSGLIETAPFEEGALVRQGDLLFVLDARPFQADLDSKLADIAKAEALEKVTGLQCRRMAQLVATKAVSQQDYDNADAAWTEAKAALTGAKAAAETSRLNLQWTRVTAPIAGRISRKYVTPGNLVTAAGGMAPGTLLTSIASIDPVYCYVDVDEKSLLNDQKLAAAKDRVLTADGRIPAQMELADETDYPHQGVIDFMDNQVNPETGTIRVRGVFANPDGRLVPGLFARMRIPGSGKYTTLLVPDSAIGTDQNNRYLLIVGPDNLVQSRAVALGPLFGGLRSITHGLEPDDSVIINGLLQARPGAAVHPEPGSIESATTQPGSATREAQP